MTSSRKWERIRAVLQGESVDRVPMSFWGHDYLREWSAEGLAQAMLAFHQKYDWDFMKVNPRASYFAEAWGGKFKPSGDPYSQPERVDYAVKSPRDWERVERQRPTEGVWAEQLQALTLINQGLAGSAPFIQTVFSPLSVAGYMASHEMIKELMVGDPKILHGALAAIMETLVGYASACLERGASGIFFATTAWATRDLITESQYLEFGRRYDLPVLAAVQEAPFNILHVCRDNNMLFLLADYPVTVVNWAATLPGNPSLKECLVSGNKPVMGGVSEKTTLAEGGPESVAAEVYAALEATGGRRFLLAPGCSISPKTPEANLMAAREACLRWPEASSI
ncbi:MAG: hypothetical protein HYU86_03120 [Chloroflexi bacterium]|nr:hypothetical protein [Chloroflexota bacterium]